MGGEEKGKLVNGVGSQCSSHYVGTRRIQHYYRWCAHLGSPQLTDVTPPADLDGLVCFAERRNLVSARVPSHFRCSLKLYLFSVNHITLYKPGNTIPIYSQSSTCLFPFETDLLKRQTMFKLHSMYVLIYKRQNKINITWYQWWYQWLTIFECKSFIGSQNNCQAHHHSSMQFNWRNNFTHGCSVSIQPSALHFLYCPTARRNYFLSPWSVYRGWGKLCVSVQTADIFIQTKKKKPGNINSQIQPLHGTHTYYRNLEQILRLNCAGTKLMNAKCQIKSS